MYPTLITYKIFNSSKVLPSRHQCDIVVLKYFSMCIEVTLLNAGGEKAKCGRCMWLYTEVCKPHIPHYDATLYGIATGPLSNNITYRRSTVYIYTYLT